MGIKPMITKFDRKKVREVRAELEKTLYQFSVENGVYLKLGNNMRFNADEFRVKLTGTVYHSKQLEKE